LRRDVFDRVGGFDESFFMFSEEIDLCLRIWQSGHRVHFLPSAEIVHFNGGSFQSSDWRREVLRYQGSLRYFRKHKSRADYHLFQLFMRFDAFLHLALLAFKFLPRRSMQTDGRRRLSLRTQDASTLLDVKTRWATLTLRTDASIRPQRLPSR
jgi:GT2 family glycosyltransferase